MRCVDWPFAGCQRGKRSVALDLKSPEHGPIARRVDPLAPTSSITTCACLPPAASASTTRRSRRSTPTSIFCHTSSYGPTGPRADWPGYDQLFQASCGWEVTGAGEGNPPMWHRFGFMDHMCAMGSVIATLLAVYHRDRTGETQFGRRVACSAAA